MVEVAAIAGHMDYKGSCYTGRLVVHDIVEEMGMTHSEVARRDRLQLVLEMHRSPLV